MTEEEKRAREILDAEVDVWNDLGVVRAMLAFAAEARADERERFVNIAVDGLINAIQRDSDRASAIRSGSETPAVTAELGEGWIGHDGGPNPLAHDPETIVDVGLKDRICTGLTACHVLWEHIDRYRIVSAKPKVDNACGLCGELISVCGGCTFPPKPKVECTHNRPFKDCPQCAAKPKGGESEAARAQKKAVNAAAMAEANKRYHSTPTPQAGK